MRGRLSVACWFFVAASVLGGVAFGQDARSLVEAAVDYYRGKASVATVDMTIHRPNWQRTFTIRAWTEGLKKSIFVITAPPKDKGNATLKRGREMWTYNPRVNRIIKLPPSMMAQAWMGSDFSNNDLAKSDSILQDYTHSLVGVEAHDGKKVYVIEAVPKPRAPVIWGRQLLKVREDYILLQEEFYDEEHQPVKVLTGYRIQMLGGKLFPKQWKMQKSGVADEYTLLNYRELLFTEDLPDRLFAVSALRTPGR